MLVMVKAGRARRNGKVTRMRSGALAMARKGACSWVGDSQAVCSRVGTLGMGISPVLAD